MAESFLLEIGVEELPPSFIEIGLGALEQNVIDFLKQNRISFGSVKKYGTPRRLAVVIENVSESQAREEREIKGPPVQVAYKDGQLTKAGQKFIEKWGISEEQLIEINTEKGAYIGARIVSESKKTTEVLKEGLGAVIKSINFPKNMHWDTGITFARPIRWLCCLFGREVVDFECGGLRGSGKSCGHRFLASDFFEVQVPEDYERQLKQRFVIPQITERKERIITLASQLLDTNEELDYDDELLDDIANLTEYPTPFVGEFSKDFLKIPAAIITTVLKKQQFLIPIKKNGQPTNRFVGVRNGNDEFIDIVRHGNERVVFARLSDALFFYKEDLKHRLDEYTERLKGVILEQRLGTMYEKVQRLKKLAPQYVKLFGFDKEVEQKVRRAAEICKSDLVTNLVFEFTELQGIIGSEYARVQGEDPEVSAAIFEHYLPRFRDDLLPYTKTGIVLSLCEKFDNLVGFFGIGEIPVGSKDPYALRRQALGIIQIILKHALRVKLSALIEKALKQHTALAHSNADSAGLVMQVREFILNRLQNFLKEEGISYDVVDAVMSVEQEDVVLISRKARALQSLKEQPDYEAVVTAVARPTNILKQGTPAAEVNADLFEYEEERTLYEIFLNVKPKFVAALKAEDFDTVVQLMLQVKPYIDNYFDRVFVNVEEERIKANRLATMKEISELFMRFADFTKLVTS